MITIFNSNRDEVIKSAVAQGSTTYAYALANLYPLIDKFEEQRKVQRKKFYERLKADILRGCIMPPITLAFVDAENSNQQNPTRLMDFVNQNIQSGYILDGMQRLTTLNDASRELEYSSTRPLSLNIIVAERYDLLLYRMITLNNGQRPMTARHQIEMLTNGMLDLENLGIVIFSEKDTENSKPPAGAFRRGDIAEAYTAFLTNNVNNQNKRIIESKLDEILVGRVMESGLTESDVSFHDVLALVEKFAAQSGGRDWLRLGNNLTGFSVGSKRSYDILKDLNPQEFADAVERFDEAFSSLDVSKINVGRYRRELSELFIAKFEQYGNAEVDTLIEAFHVATITD